jgi:hypothetical protein
MYNLGINHHCIAEGAAGKMRAACGQGEGEIQGFRDATVGIPGPHIHEAGRVPAQPDETNLWP